ncbi:hypothetical protein D3C80_1350810 [compost metagenome]
MHIALHGGDHHLAVAGTFFFAGLNVRLEIGHGLLHHTRGFHHLRQEHFPLAEQIAHHVHAIHQRPFNHFNRACSQLARFFGIQLDKLSDPFHQRIFQTFFHIPRTPFRLLNIRAFIRFAAAIFLCQIQHAFSGIIATV